MSQLRHFKAKTAGCLVLALFALQTSTGAPGAVARTADELAKTLFIEKAEHGHFDLIGTVTYRRRDRDNVIALRDKTGSVIVYGYDNIQTTAFDPGNKVRLRGYTAQVKSGYCHAVVKTAKFLGAGTPPPAPPLVTADLLMTGACDFSPVRLNGIVRSVFVDEFNPQWAHLVLGCSNTVVYTGFPIPPDNYARLSALEGGVIDICGIASPTDHGPRRNIGRTFNFDGMRDVRVHAEPTSDSNALPKLSSVANLQPNQVFALGRHRQDGHVTAVWGSDSFLLETPGGRSLHIRTRDGDLPPLFASVTAVGFPTTDLFRLGLMRATWKLRPNDPPQTNDCSASLLDLERLDPYLHGKRVRFDGVVSTLADGATVVLRNGLKSVIVDRGPFNHAFDEIVIGCQIEVSGICIVEADDWRMNAVLPQVKTTRIVLDDAHGIRILKTPRADLPTWLLVTLAILLVAVVIIAIWNRMLNKVVIRRSRELLKEEIAHAKSEFRIEERTRLAIDLHDSLSQNLTGLAMQLDAIDRLVTPILKDVAPNLSVAKRILHSTREEMRNCLWDLRNRALEEPDFAEAVRLTLKPHLDETTLDIDLSIPRERLSDNTTHILLCIVRELVANALRHGKADRIGIGGQLLDDCITLSVTDNGCGFDPDKRLGVAQGHFGLQGIRERLRPFGGDLQIDSTPKQTCLTITLQLKRHG